MQVKERIAAAQRVEKHLEQAMGWAPSGSSHAPVNITYATTTTHPSTYTPASSVGIT